MTVSERFVLWANLKIDRLERVIIANGLERASLENTIMRKDATIDEIKRDRDRLARGFDEKCKEFDELVGKYHSMKGWIARYESTIKHQTALIDRLIREHDGK